ncbi:hypothetical protein FGIG_05647, partial [Fasciola gigantica]
LLKVSKSRNLRLFADPIWCLDSNLLTNAPAEFTEFSVFIPIQNTSEKTMSDCKERLTNYYRREMTSNSLYDFLAKEEPVTVTGKMIVNESFVLGYSPLNQGVSIYNGDVSSLELGDDCKFKLDRGSFVANLTAMVVKVQNSNNMILNFLPNVVIRVKAYVPQQNRKDFRNLSASEIFSYFQENPLCNHVSVKFSYNRLLKQLF